MDTQNKSKKNRKNNDFSQEYEVYIDIQDDLSSEKILEASIENKVGYNPEAIRRFIIGFNGYEDLLVVHSSSKQNVRRLPKDSLHLLDSIAEVKGVLQEDIIYDSLVRFFEEVEKELITKEAKRISIELPNNIAHLLELVSKSQGISQNETILEAINLYVSLQKEKIQGHKIIIEKSGDKRIQLLLI